MKTAGLILTFLMASCTPTYEPPANQNPDQPDFSQAKKLIEANCADCVGATKEGLVKGIESMQKALDAGYIDRGAALRLLAEAYNELAHVYAKPDSIEQGQALGRRRGILEQLIAFAPNDPAVRFEYAMMMADRNQRILALREILAVEPLHEDTRFGLATSLAEEKTGQAEAAKLLRELVETKNPERALAYARRLHGVLLQLGRKAEAEALSQRFNL
jgi:hypothetical protein